LRATIISAAAHETLREALRKAHKNTARHRRIAIVGGIRARNAKLEDELAAFSGGFVDQARALFFSTVTWRISRR